MVIFKTVTAWELLNTFASDEWDTFGDLVKYCLDNHKEDALDNVITRDYFPNGCDEDEFKKFLAAHVGEVMAKL